MQCYKHFLIIEENKKTDICKFPLIYLKFVYTQHSYLGIEENIPHSLHKYQIGICTRVLRERRTENNLHTTSHSVDSSNEAPTPGFRLS